MKVVIFLLCLLSLQQEIPFKPKDQFEVQLDFKFKTRYVNSSLIELEKSPTTTGAMLPYLTLNINVLKLNAGEIRVRIEDNRGQLIYNKKAAEGMVANIDLGYTDDIKDGISAHQYQVNFIDKEKKCLSRILIDFEKDGTYLVNGEKRGKL
jgi:hypothetical protein